jgi:hypothetical protein
MGGSASHEVIIGFLNRPGIGDCSAIRPLVVGLISLDESRSTITNCPVNPMG